MVISTQTRRPSENPLLCPSYGAVFLLHSSVPGCKFLAWAVPRTVNWSPRLYLFCTPLNWQVVILRLPCTLLSTFENPLQGPSLLVERGLVSPTCSLLIPAPVYFPIFQQQSPQVPFTRCFSSVALSSFDTTLSFPINAIGLNLNPFALSSIPLLYFKRTRLRPIFVYIFLCR
jgi:hypothetical protein